MIQKKGFCFYKGRIYNLYYNNYSKDSIDKKIKDGLLMPYKVYIRDKKIDEILNS
jgi:hypothetical protein